MFQAQSISTTDKTKFYANLAAEIDSLLDKTQPWFTNLANASASLKHHLPDINWVGFYLAHGSDLYLGPFQGLPACLRIPLGKGVCGTSAKERQALLVPDVDQFPGHIACDSASRSEIVVPLLQGDRLLGVLDIDSPLLSRFDEIDKTSLTRIAHLVATKSVWPSAFI